MTSGGSKIYRVEYRGVYENLLAPLPGGMHDIVQDKNNVSIINKKNYNFMTRG